MRTQKPREHQKKEGEMALETGGVGGAYHGQQPLQEEEEKPLFPFGWPAYAAFGAVGCAGMLFLVLLTVLRVQR
jgi:hypothetical protein